jgi:hypothetical protein
VHRYERRARHRAVRLAVHALASLFRVAMLLLLVNVAVGVSAWSFLWIVDAVLIVVSVSADVANFELVRVPSSAPPSDYLTAAG